MFIMISIRKQVLSYLDNFLLFNIHSTKSKYQSPIEIIY